VARTLEAGADEYLVKEDLESALLRRTIRRAIARGRLRLELTPSLPASRTEPLRPERALLHDLKNVHTSIVGNAQILRTEVGDEDFLRRRADALLVAARTAIELTERLLGGTDAPEGNARSVDLSELVRSAEPLLRAALPERIELRLALADHLALVVAREERLRCALLELVVNAVEAIGDTGGSIEIRTGATVVREADVPRLFAPAGFTVGPSVWLEVRDSGRGFDPAGLPRLLARGVTTKGAGRGEGLSTVEQTLAAHRAALFVHSRVREGSAFRILLPSGE
jgi:signal transduction histidine kinase